MSQFTKNRIRKNVFSFPISLFLFPFSLFLIPFSVFLFPCMGDQYMSLDIGFDTIVLLIATIIQSERMHVSVKIV